MVKTFLFYVNVSALTLSDFELPTPHIAHFLFTFASLHLLFFDFPPFFIFPEKMSKSKKVVTISMFCLCIVQL